MFPRYSPLLIFSLIAMLGCAPSRDESDPAEKYPDLVQLTPPGTQKAQDSNIYIDSVQVIRPAEIPVLLIRGSLPDGCTRIGQAGFRSDDNSVSLMLEAWRDPDKICTQALVSFSFIYREIPVSILSAADSIHVNGTAYRLNVQP